MVAQTVADPPALDTVAGPPALDTVADLDLVELTRSGDRSAFGELWRRHSGAGRAVARSYSNEPDDILAESFARILTAIRSGGGPKTAFRAYLFTTIRSVAYQAQRGARTDTVEDFDSYVDVGSEEAASLDALDKSLTVQAFRSLPTRWQEALWYSEVEQLSSADIAPLLGMKPNAVNALTFRAREGLRQAWIQVHLARSQDGECAAIIERLGSYARGSLGTRETKRVEDHLAICPSCRAVADEAHKVSSTLALVLLPLAAGFAEAAGYTAWIQTSAQSGGAVAAAVSKSAATGGAHVAAAVTTKTGFSAIAAGVSVAAAAATALLVVPISLAQPPIEVAQASGPDTVIVEPVPTPELTGPARFQVVPKPEVPQTDGAPLPEPDPGVRTVDTRTSDPVADPPAALLEAPAPPQTQPVPGPPPVPEPTTVPVPLVTIVADPSGLYLPSVWGTAEPDTTVELVDEVGTVLGQSLADQSGAFEFAFTEMPGLTFGTTNIGVRQVAVDSFGIGSGSEVSPLTAVALHPIDVIDPTPPSGTIINAPGPLPVRASVVPGSVVRFTTLTGSTADVAETSGIVEHVFLLTTDDAGQDYTIAMRYFDDATGRVGPERVLTYSVIFLG